MTLSSEQFHTLYDGAAQPVILVRDGAVAELNCHAQELFAVGTALRAYLPQDAALPEMLYARPAVLPVMAGGVCVSANTQPLDDALLLFLPPQDTRDELAAFCRAAQSISTPLTTLLSVSGTLFPLLSEAEDPAVQQNLAVLNRACYQLLRASENLTDLSYVQHGRLPLSLEKTDLTDFLDGLAQRADELCRQMGLALEADLPQAPIFVWIDRRQVRRALLALLSNAVKFSAPGGTLHLTLTRHGRRAVIRLSDSGEGMDAEILCSAFHRYARPEIPEDSRFGAGFSLPVVQAIMQAHGGSLLLQSQRGGGTDALLAQSLARCAAERTGGVVMPTLFIGTERERPASILRDKGFENPERLYVLGMDVPKNSMKSFYAREDMFAVIVREHLRLLPAHRDRQRPRRVGADLDARTAGR